MITEHDPRMSAAIAEMEERILAQYPGATFDVATGEDPDGIYLTATVDVDDTDEVFDLIVGRLLEMQVEEGLPLHVLPVRPIERVVAELRTRAPAWSRPLLPIG
jgi:hypothetical protein